MVSVTDGRSGHHEISPPDLVTIRREEARASGQLVGAESITWDFADGGLQADLALRAAIIREIRSFGPDLVLTHRLWDYHPDHRAVAQAVQDACYLVTVPHIAADVPVLPRDPVVAYMVDTFTRPQRFLPHVLLNVDDELDTFVRMTACHQSQVFQWLPYHDGLLESVPDEEHAGWSGFAIGFWQSMPSVANTSPSSWLSVDSKMQKPSKPMKSVNTLGHWKRLRPSVCFRVVLPPSGCFADRRNLGAVEEVVRSGTHRITLRQSPMDGLFRTVANLLANRWFNP